MSMVVFPARRRGPPGSGRDHRTRITTFTYGVACHGGLGRSAAASLVVKLDSGKVHVALTNRGIPIEAVNGHVLRALADS